MSISEVFVSFTAAVALIAAANPVYASPIVIGPDVNTLATEFETPEQGVFAVNIADVITAGDPNKSILMFESSSPAVNPDFTDRNYSQTVLSDLSSAGFDVTVTPDYTTPFSCSQYGGIFVATGTPTAFLDNTALINYTLAGCGVYLVGGVIGDPDAQVEADGWATFLNYYGLELASSYGGPNVTIPITSTNPLFNGVSSLSTYGDQPVINLGTNPNVDVLQMFDGTNVVTEVTGPSTPEPGTVVLLGIGTAMILVGTCLQREQNR